MGSRNHAPLALTLLVLQVTEADLANFFMDCGQVLDCRICGDPNSATRFAFIEFGEAEGALKVLRDCMRAFLLFYLRLIS